MAQASARDRVSASRARRRAAGLKRVEVYVPADKVDLLKAHAAQLREGSASETLAAARKLIARAYKRFHARCLDSINIDPERASLPDAAVVAAALIHRGDAEAYKLGQKLRKLAR
jgi:hypothetical protein